MLIGLCGGICSGKHSIADYLVEYHGFTTLHLSQATAIPLVKESEYQEQVDAVDSVDSDCDIGAESFNSADLLLDYVTKRWQKRWVTIDLWGEDVLEGLQRRPFFILVSVDAPVSLRWNRFKRRCHLNSQQPPSLEDFVVRNDDHLYNDNARVARLIDRAELRLINSSSSLEMLYEALECLDLVNEQRLRPSWDQYFMQLASLAAQRSNCMKRRVGCVLVREKRVISTGYNGTPRNLQNCNEGGCGFMAHFLRN
ncbi:Deoxycytidine monophosphate (dCMP) deaminase [Schaereria dolodes]|nr:Deoxycytidine monophosphate (dCMP) deaminase [Schaereria dolodes]